MRTHARDDSKVHEAPPAKVIQGATKTTMTRVARHEHVARRTPHVARRTWHEHPARRTPSARCTQHPARSTCHNRSMPALLISTYDLGRQPFGLASAAAVLRAAGVDVACLDLAKQRLDL